MTHAVRMPDADDLITSSEAARILGRSARTVARLAKAGELPHAGRLTAARGVYLFRRSDVEAFAAARAEATA